MNIVKRKSIRTYTCENLKEDHKNKIVEYISNHKNLIGINNNKITIKLRESDGTIGGKIGTYGMINNAPAYLVLICKNDKDNMLDCGYVFEKMVLFLQELGLGTCWLAGTFNRKQLMIEEDFDSDYFIPIISPVGYAVDKMPMKEKIVRIIPKSDKRKEFDSLFFYKDFHTKISNEKLRRTLEMVRLAPSASNKQPWRVVMDEDDCAHFYIKRNPSYLGTNSLGFDVQWLDIGIALSHYEIASNKSEFYYTQPNINIPFEHMEYVISVK